MNKEQMQIAETIRQQLYAGGRTMVWCWGTNSFMAMPPTDDSLGGLRFKVTGFLHQGVVYIKLAGDDTYTIELWKKMMDKPEEVISGIYCDQLTEVIDAHVESGR